MTEYNLIRLGAVSVVAVLSLADLQDITWFTMVAVLGLVHYLMGFYYSGRKAKEVLERPIGYLFLFALGVTGLSLYFGKFSLMIYFAFHHAFNEAYILKPATRKEAEAKLGAFRAAAFYFHLLIYFAILRHHPAIYFVPPRMWIAGLAIAVPIYCFHLNRVWPALKPHERADQISFEIFVACMLLLSLFTRIHLSQIFCYHFIFWLLLQFRVVFKRNFRIFPQFFATVVGLHLLVLLLLPGGPLQLPAKDRFLGYLFYLFSYLHITYSLALSDINPGWIIRWFRPKAAILQEK